MTTRGRRRPATAAAGGAFVVAMLTGCVGGGETGGDTPDVEGGFDWRRFEGEQISVVLNQHPWQETIEPRITQFEELTGIEVDVRSLPEEQMRQRVQVELSTRSPDLDVFMTGALAEGRLFQQQGWYEDLGHYVDDASLTAPDYDYADFADDVVAAHEIDGAQIGVPIQIETTMLFYRTDVFSQLGLQPPETLAELEKVAAAVTEAGDVYGFAGRGRGAAATSQFSSILYNFGAEWNDDAGDAAFDTAEGREAFEYYGRLLREYGPPGSVNNSWEEVLPLFQQGETAMIADGSVFVSQLTDPGESTVADSVGFAPMPSGPGGDWQAFWGWALAMSPFSEAKGPAWYFIQWATGPETVAAVQQEDGVAGARSSVTEFPPSVPEEWVETFERSRERTRSQHPTVAPVPEVRDAVGNALVTAIEGGSVDDAVAKAAREFDQAVEASGP